MHFITWELSTRFTDVEEFTLTVEETGSLLCIDSDRTGGHAAAVDRDQRDRGFPACNMIQCHRGLMGVFGVLLQHPKARLSIAQQRGQIRLLHAAQMVLARSCTSLHLASRFKQCMQIRPVKVASVNDKVEQGWLVSRIRSFVIMEGTLLAFAGFTVSFLDLGSGHPVQKIFPRYRRGMKIGMWGPIGC